jgi:hypothetical protein
VPKKREAGAAVCASTRIAQIESAAKTAADANIPMLNLLFMQTPGIESLCPVQKRVSIAIDELGVQKVEPQFQTVHKQVMG